MELIYAAMLLHKAGKEVNEENVKKQQEYSKGRCDGVPFFLNTDTDKFICGEAEYEDLKDLAIGK